VVHGDGGLDEVSTTGPTKVSALENGKISEFTIKPGDIGIEEVSMDKLVGGSASQNAKSLRDVLAGGKGAYRDVVLLNAASALVAGGHAANLQDGAKRAINSIDEGAAKAALERLVDITNGKAGS